MHDTFDGRPVGWEPRPAREAADRPIRRRPLHDEVTERLRDLIVEGRLAPGERVNEAAFCKRFDVSRTPLREALKVLASEGLIELLPRRGARVVAVTAEEVGQLFEVLSGLERTAAELAAARRTAKNLAALKRLQERIEGHHRAGDLHNYFRVNTELHQAIVAAAANPVLRELHERLMTLVRRVRYQALLSPSRWEEAVGEHAAILAALEAGEARRAGELMSQHVGRTGQIVRAALDHAARTPSEPSIEAEVGSA